MDAVTVTEARANLAELLHRVASKGERITIERRSVPCAVLVPIDDLKQQDAARAGPTLRATEILFNETERLARLGHWEWDQVEGRCTYCSDELARMHGVTVKEFLRRTTSSSNETEWIHPEDCQRYLTAIKALREKGEGFEMEFRLCQPDGSYLDVREIAEPVFDEQGSVIRSFGFIQDITEQKKTENALRQNEALLRQAMRTARMGMWVWDDAKDECIYCSEELAQLFDESVDEYLATRTRGDGVTALVHPDDREHYKKCIDDAEETGSRYSVEFREMVGDGTYRHFREVGERIYDEDDVRQTSTGILQDITELKEIEQTLRASEVALSNAQRQARIGSWHWDIPRNKLISCSEEYAQIHGVTLEEAPPLLAAQMERVVHPDDRERVEAEFKRFDDEGIDYEIEYRIVRPDGDVRHVVEIGETLFDGDGRPVEQTGTVQDITRRKRAEEELERYRDNLEKMVEERTVQLRDSERRYRELFDESPVAIWEEDWTLVKQMLDDLERGGVKDWRDYFNSHREQLKTAYDLAKIVEISSATLELYREDSKESILKGSVAAVVIDEELDAFRDIVLSFATGQMTVDIEAKDVAGDWSEMIVRRRVVMPAKYRDDWSRVIYAIEDITGRVRAEEQLRQAQKMEAVGQLTGGIAHDFNNLLTVISGNLQLLGRALKNDERQHARVRNALHATRRGADAIERLLAFSRRQVLEPKTLLLGSVLDGLGSLLRSTLGETIKMSIGSQKDLWSVKADQAQLENAIINLAVNARDAMPEGGRLMIEATNVTLTEADVEGTSGDHVMITVTDEGHGMTPEILQQAIDPFFTTKEVGKGTGLGLSMIYGFAEQSGGKLWIESDVDQGTQVRLYLPRTYDEEPQEVMAAQVGQDYPGGHETILLVEDEPHVRATVVEFLNELGYRVIEADQAASALAILDQDVGIDLMITDIVMPGGMDGLKLAQKARARQPSIKILITSGYASNMSATNEDVEAMSAFVKKPYLNEDLAGKIRELLDMT